VEREVQRLDGHAGGRRDVCHGGGRVATLDDQISYAATRAQYEKVAQAVDLDGQTPKGLICHAVAENASGEVVIVDVWESSEASAEFARERVFPAFASTGNDELAAQGPPQAYETFHLVREH
jgi:heme-degrading monooxygenase HmoA